MNSQLFSFLLTSHIYYWDICKIAAMLALLLAAAIYFMTTFILSEYYKLERGRFITALPLFNACGVVFTIYCDGR